LANRHETLPLDHYLVRLDNPGPKILGPSPKKFGAKDMQNLDRFYTTSNFYRQYLRNETRYKKSERHVISSDSSRVQPNKSGKLWSTIHKVVHVSLDPPKSLERAMMVSYRLSIMTVTLSVTIRPQFAIKCLRRSNQQGGG